MDILQSHVHGSYSNTKVFKAGEQIEEVMGRQGKFGRFDIMGRESQVWEGEGSGKSTRCGGGGSR